MPTIISHGVAAAALGTAFPRRTIPRWLIFVGIACSMAPDIDAFGLRSGIQYGDLLGHRGITHSVLFAAILASVVFLCVLFTLAPCASRSFVWIYLFLATVSHGLLDAATDNAGLGIPFFWPLDNTRYFFPLTPIAMSPIGTDFFSTHGFSVMLSEFQWVWIPSLIFAILAISVRWILTIRFASNHNDPLASDAAKRD